MDGACGKHATEGKRIEGLGGENEGIRPHAVPSRV
jgi:hypothetical protein